MTEQEARTKWCPMARSSDNGVSINRTDDLTCKPDKDCMCIGSECMTWRWDEGRFETTLERPNPCRMEDGWNKNDTGMGIMEYSRPNPNRKGYCGLGGKP